MAKSRQGWTVDKLMKEIAVDFQSILNGHGTWKAYNEARMYYIKTKKMNATDAKRAALTELYESTGMDEKRPMHISGDAVAGQDQDDFIMNATKHQRSTGERVFERLNAMPKKYRHIYTRAMQGKSRKAAMNAFCLECCGWQRKEVAACTSEACPLYCFRPYRKML